MIRPAEAKLDHYLITCSTVPRRFAPRRPPPAVPGGASYYSDAAVLAPAFNLPMVIIGPGRLGMSGQTDEHVMTADVIRAAGLYRRIALAWLEA